MDDNGSDLLPQGIKLTPFDPIYRQYPYRGLSLLRDRAPVFRNRQVTRMARTCGRGDGFRHNAGDLVHASVSKGRRWLPT
jgi:hypothetical protein